MRVLGVETSTFVGGVACVADGVVVAETTLDVRQTHTAVLLPSIDRVLHDAGWTIDDVECIGVSLGPGSFTSLRIGLSTVRGLACKRNTPVVGVETLRAMAHPFRSVGQLIVPLIDARQGEHYAARYRFHDDRLDEEAAAGVGTIEELLRDIHEPVCCPGDVDDALATRVRAAIGHEVYVPQPRLAGAHPAVIAHLAAADLAAGRAQANAPLTPRYLRDHLGRKPAA